MINSANISWTKYVAVVVLAAGIIISWANSQSDLSETKKNIVSLERAIEKIEDRIHDSELKAVADSTVLSIVRDDISTIKDDVKDIKERLSE